MNALVVGSTLIDIFVKLDDKNKLEINDSKVTLNLGDKIPVDIKALSLGGNGGNVSSALQRLDISTTLYTYLGKDVLSNHIKTVIEQKGIKLVVEELDSKASSLSLIFDFPTDRIIFSHHTVTNYGFDSSRIKELPEIIFLTSIGQEWENAYEKVLEYSEATNVPLVFSPGSQQLKDINETFIKTVHKAKVLMCNREEATKIYAALAKIETKDPKELLLGIKNYGFDLVSITDGQNGAYAIDDKNQMHKVNSPTAQGHEKTGAGDAYAGGFLGGYIYKKPIDACMKWGVLNALGEMRYVGAQTGQLNLDEMENELQTRNDLIVENL